MERNKERWRELEGYKAGGKGRKSSAITWVMKEQFVLIKSGLMTESAKSMSMKEANSL